MNLSLSSTERFTPMQNQSQTASWQHTAIHSSAEIPSLAETMAKQMLAAGFTDKDVFCFRLAVEEAIVNGVNHGNRADPAKRVSVRHCISPAEAIVEVEDEGSGFNPEAVADPLAPENIERPSGRGIFLMRFYMSWIKYNPRGNCVTLCRANTAAARAC